MNLLILSPKLPYPPKDGGAIATLNLATGLAKAGIKVTLLAINTKKHYFAPDQLPATLRSLVTFKTVYRDTTPKAWPAVRNLLFSRIPYIAERFVFKAFEQALIELLEEGDFDFVQMEGPYFMPYLEAIRRHSAARVSLRAHNVEHKIWEQRYRSERNLVTRSYLQNMTGRIRKLEQKIAREADLLIAISEADERYFREEAGTLKSLTIPAGIDLENYRPKHPVTGASIFFIGSLDWMPNREGLEWFIMKVLPLILEELPDISFHVAGRNAPEEFLEVLSQPGVVYHGEVDDAGTFMERYRIMAVPLLTGSGIRIKILEGMAMGKCIVTTSLGTEGIPVENHKHLVIANDENSFATSLKTLLNDGQKAEAMSHHARELILEKFDTFALATRLKKAYNESA